MNAEFVVAEILAAGVRRPINFLEYSLITTQPRTGCLPENMASPMAMHIPYIKLDWIHGWSGFHGWIGFMAGLQENTIKYIHGWIGF